MASSTAPVQKTCLCGCLAPVARTFLPGHDAKLKGRLIREARDGDWRQSATAVDSLLERGWARFVPASALERYIERAPNGSQTWDIRNIVDCVTDASGTSHAHAFCKSFQGPGTRHANDPALNGWLCSDCISVYTVQERVADQSFAQWVFASPDAEWTLEDVANGTVPQRPEPWAALYGDDELAA